jgi:DNA-directed RNA polymerase subunit H (RpoH/RPB5)
MKLEDIFYLIEARGSGSFDLKYWYWAKKDEKYGLGYVRRENIPNIKDGYSTEDEKVEINMKRLDTIVDLFSSPIVIYWIDKKLFDVQKRIGATKTLGKAKDIENPEEGEKMMKSIEIEIFKLPRKKSNDLTIKKDNGKIEDIDIVDIYRDKRTRNAWATTKEGPPALQFVFDINDKEGDTLNTVYAKFIKKLYHEGDESYSDLRKLARNETLEGVMKSLRIKNDKGVEIIPFLPNDYKMLPDGYSSKKFLDAEKKNNLGEFIKENADKLETAAKKRF